MEGDKISVITGDDFSITCTTDLDADEIQWILDGETVLSSSNSMELHLSLPLDDGEYTQQVFTCKSIHSNGNQSASIIITYLYRKEVL